MVTSAPSVEKPSEPQVIDFAPIHDHFASSAIQNFKKDGVVHSNVLFVRLQRPITRQPLPTQIKPLDPALTHQFMSSNTGKDVLGEFIREALTANTPVRLSLSRSLGFEPDLAVHLAEAWMANASTLEEAQAVAPSARADRREVVMIAIHHRWGGTVVNTLPIIQQPNRHVKFQRLQTNIISVLGPMAMTPDNRA